MLRKEFEIIQSTDFDHYTLFLPTNGNASKLGSSFSRHIFWYTGLVECRN